MLRNLISRVGLGVALLAAPLSSTWSIVVVDRATGEVGVVVATCLEDFNLRRVIPAVVPEIGISAHQSIGDPNGSQRLTVYELLQLGYIAPDIMLELNSGDPLVDSRQIGVASMTGHAATFTGASCGDWGGGVTGESGSWVYAVQGNVLAGAPVVTTAEAVLLNTPGSMADRLMAAMEASGLMGGDGRCSCSQADPTSCGTPPPSFSKSAHAFTMIVARPGDPIGDCNQNSCARGDLYCIVNITDNGANDPDVIGVARQEYDAWKVRQIGRPDGLNSIAWLSSNEIEVGDTTPVQIVLDLRDINNTALQNGGAILSLGHGRWSAGGATLQTVHDHQDGTYTLDILPGPSSGRDQLLVQIDDGGPEQITLWPPLDLLVKAPQRAPFAPPQIIAGLNLANEEYSGFLFEDGLTAWRLEGNAGETHLKEATRLSATSLFSTDQQIVIEETKYFYFDDFWASNDRLRIWLSGHDAQGGPPQIWFSERASTTSAFPKPTPVDELNSGHGDGDMWLSSDEKHLVFASKRNGNWGLWQSHRWQNQGRWLEPEIISSLDTNKAERYPLLIDGGAQLVFARINSNADINIADLSVTGEFINPRPAPGSLAPGFLEMKPSSFDYQKQSLWLDSNVSFSKAIAEATLTTDSFSVSSNQLSISNGDSLQFQLDAGPQHSGADYFVLLSTSGVVPGMKWNDAWIPLNRDSWTYWCLNSNSPALHNFQGQLDVNGTATATLNILPNTAPPTLIGESIDVLFVSEIIGSSFVSQNQQVLITP